MSADTKPAPDDAVAAVVAGLTRAQREALALSADGWDLSFYIPAGAMPSERRGAVGSPYWMMRPGLSTPKAPHWSTAIALQKKGLVEPYNDAAPCTPLGLSVRAALAKSKGEQG